MLYSYAKLASILFVLSQIISICYAEYEFTFCEACHEALKKVKAANLECPGDKCTWEEVGREMNKGCATLSQTHEEDPIDMLHTVAKCLNIVKRYWQETADWLNTGKAVDTYCPEKQKCPNP